MFHLTNLGKFAGELKQYADLNGYVPEAGDDHSAMEWDAATKWEADAWREHVAAAVLATEQAEQDVAEWRTAN